MSDERDPFLDMLLAEQRASIEWYEANLRASGCPPDVVKALVDAAGRELPNSMGEEDAPTPEEPTR